MTPSKLTVTNSKTLVFTNLLAMFALQFSLNFMQQMFNKECLERENLIYGECHKCSE